MNSTPLEARAASRSGCLAAFRAFVVGIALCCLASAPAFAQTATGSLTGRVSDAASGRSLTNARVTVVGTGKSVFTDEYGQYRVSDVPAGPVELRVFYTGLDERVVTVEVTPGTTTQTSVALGGDPAAGETVELSAFRVEAYGATGDAMAINEQRFSPNLKNVVAADAFGDVTEGNPGEFIKYLPGVSVEYVAADVRSISVRGFGPDFTTVNVDGNRMASASSSGSNRSFELEQVSMNNVAQIEVVKVPLPSMPADSLGGSVNLVSKNAFERETREITYRAYLSINDESTDFDKTPGPGNSGTRKIRPGFDFSYAEPISSTFGIVVNGLRSDQFNEQHRTRTSWQFSGGDASPSTPYMRTYTFQDGPKETLRQSIGINADWKATSNSVLSFGYQWNDYESFFGNRNYNINAGSNATDFTPTETNGRNNAGEITGGTSFRNKYGTTHHTNLDFKYYGAAVQLDAGIYYSHATNFYRDTKNGHFSAVNTRVRQLDVSFADIQAYHPPGSMTAIAPDGSEVSFTELDDFRLRNVRSQPHSSSDEFTGGHLDLTKDLNELAIPLELTAGISTRQQERDLVRAQFDWDYVGPDGDAESADDGAGAFLDDHYINQDPHFGLPDPEWISPYEVYQHFLDNPSYFIPNIANHRNRVQNDYLIEERVSAAYLQAEAKFLENRLSAVGGVRFEKTEVDGLGFRFDPDAIYRRNADGSFVLDDEGERVTITDDPYAQEELQYQSRAQEQSSSYDGYYPSLHFTYNIKDNFLLRLAYAKTLGRPNFANILPGTVIEPDDTAAAGEPGGSITVRNTALQPYEADSFDLSLEYYFKPAGVVSVGVFRKDITNFFGSISKLVDEQDLALYDLEPQYLGWNLETSVNAGDARVTGLELNYVQQLSFASGFWRNFSVFGNGTFLDLDGESAADFSNFVEKTANWGVSYTGSKFDAKVKWNYRGEQFRSFQSSLNPGGAEYYDDRLYLDLNFEYAFSRNFILFLNARNISETPQKILRYGDETPDYARTYQLEEFGVQYAIGIKGSF